MKNILQIIVIALLLSYSFIAYAISVDPIDLQNDEIVWSGEPRIYFVYGQTAWNFYKECVQTQTTDGCNIITKIVRIVETEETFDCDFILIREL